MKSENLILTLVGMIIKVILVVAIIIFAYRGVTTCYDYGYRIFTEPPVSTGEGIPVTVSILQDTSPSDMGKMFENAGLIRDAKLFVLQYYCSDYRKELKPGVYELSTAMTAEEMFEAMAMVPEEEEE